MSRDFSRSKFGGVREKLSRFRREYFCIRSLERRSAARRDRSDVAKDADGEHSLPPLLSGRSSVAQRHSCDGARSVTRSGGRSTPDDDSRLLRRHSVPSRCVSIPESPEEEEEEDVEESVETPVCLDCRPASAAIPNRKGDLKPVAVGVSAGQHGFSTETDGEDYNEFVRGLRLITATVVAVSGHPQRPSEAAQVHAGTSHCSVRPPETSCCVGSQASGQADRRSFGGKLIDTLRKTLSSGGVGKADRMFGRDVGERPPSCLARGGAAESMQPARKLDVDCRRSNGKQPLVSCVTWGRWPIWSRSNFGGMTAFLQ